MTAPARPHVGCVVGGSTIADFFQQVESRSTPWPAGRVDLHWHALFPAEVVDRQLVAPYREITHRPGLAPVPARWVHLTVLHAGPLADYRDGEVDAIVQRVRDRCAGIEPFELVVDRPVVGRVAIECQARPGAPARRLWEMTARVDADVTGGRFPRLPADYYPHVSLAYGTSGESHQTGADRVALKRDLSDHPGEPVTLTVDQLVLVAQVHDRRHITWTPMATAPLGRSAADRGPA